MEGKGLDKKNIGQGLSHKQKEIIEGIKKRGRTIVIKKPFEIYFRCSKTSRDFIVFLEKRDNAGYVVTNVSKAQGEHRLSGIGNKAESFNVNNAKKEEIGMDMIENIEDIVCPYCGSRTIVKCGCGSLGCGGSLINDDKGSLYRCPWCGGSGYIMGTFDKIKGNVNRERLFLKGKERDLLQKQKKGTDGILNSGK